MLGGYFILLHPVHGATINTIQEIQRYNECRTMHHGLRSCTMTKRRQTAALSLALIIVGHHHIQEAQDGGDHVQDCKASQP